MVVDCAVCFVTFMSTKINVIIIIIIPSDQLICCHLSLPEVKSIVEKLRD